MFMTGFLPILRRAWLTLSNLFLGSEQEMKTLSDLSPRTSQLGQVIPLNKLNSVCKLGLYYVNNSSCSLPSNV